MNLNKSYFLEMKKAPCQYGRRLKKKKKKKKKLYVNSTKINIVKRRGKLKTQRFALMKCLI